MEKHDKYSFGNSRYVPVILIASLLTLGMVPACFASELSPAGSQPNPQSMSKDGKNSKTQLSTLPIALSQLDGWHGIKLEKKYRPPKFYCSCKLPMRFGLQNRDEKTLLLHFIRDDFLFDRDINCEFIGCKQDAVNHAFRLAAEYQDAEAARWFVMPKGLSILKLDLSGELGERYNTEYRPTVLIKFQNLRRIVPLEEETVLAQEICAIATPSADSFLDGAGIDPVIKSLKRKGMNSLAAKLLNECGG